MRPALVRSLPGCLLLTLLVPAWAQAMDATVPSVPYPDLQTAVAALAASPDVINHILVAAPSISTNSSIVVGNAFGASRQLVIRPSSTLARAEIRSNGTNAPIISLLGCGHVQIQDLDIVRTITNTADLIQTLNTTFITVERCRIGSSEPPGTTGLSYISIVYPGDGGLTVRNCIFFSTFQQAFDNGINVVAMGDVTNELFLYNNCVADYNKTGIQVNDAIVGSLVLLRNNLVVNNVVSVPEPVAYHSAVVPGAIVVTSDNVAFATPAKVQTLVPPNQDLYGTAASEVGIDLPATSLEESSAFVTMAWDPGVGAANADFYRTLATGPLHANSSTWGVTVGAGTPDPHDLAVWDDIEGHFRPGGSPAHTDRGPFQVDPAAAGVDDAPVRSHLRIAPERNPAQLLRLRFASGDAGELTARLFDITGRSVGLVQRSVSAGESGLLEWPRMRPGVYAYRVSVRGAGLRASEASGRLSIVR